MLLCGRANSSSGLRTDVRCHIPPNPGRSGKEDRDERRLYRSFDSRVRMEYKVPYGGYTLYMYCILLWSFNYARFSGAAKNTRVALRQTTVCISGSGVLTTGVVFCMRGPSSRDSNNIGYGYFISP